jgi:two-component system sensor kinase FixL
MDRGTGLPPETLARLFQPFFTTKRHGLGLGLAISRSIVQNHGGRLWAENNDGQGATFFIALPLSGHLPA